MNKLSFLGFLFILMILANNEALAQYNTANEYTDMIDYTGTPESPSDRSSLVFSDQGAWFGFGLPDTNDVKMGFTGPFMMTQDNGVWMSPMLVEYKIYDHTNSKWISVKDMEYESSSSLIGLSQEFSNETFQIKMAVYFINANKATVDFTIRNLTDKPIEISVTYKLDHWLENFKISNDKHTIIIKDEKSGHNAEIHPTLHYNTVTIDDTKKETVTHKKELKAGYRDAFPFSFSFYFEPRIMQEGYLTHRVPRGKGTLHKEKSFQLVSVHRQMHSEFKSQEYKQLAAKCMLTLQNNWRSAAGELEYAGLFPSYNYKWFHGFWAWDSWKHATAVALYDPNLAKDQVRAMYAFIEEDGFIPDCVYRDTLQEKHNYRNTKPPLSAWAVWKIHKQRKDFGFLQEMYPKIVKQHMWWYNNRDHDGDSICEFGSTDGSLIAAKWESGMDNAVRFDNSKILKNHDEAYSLNQESVDLNSYLYMEKLFLALIADELKLTSDANELRKDARRLKLRIQKQFFDEETGWFYDTSIDGDEFIKIKGCEGWTPLFTMVATEEQASLVKQTMLDTSEFYLKVPFQTLTATHPDFKPDGGYWRGPVWLDQTYFAIEGLRNYGFDKEATDASIRVFNNCEGLMENGPSIRENYDPVNGEGLEANNFSWSAGHILLLLTN